MSYIITNQDLEQPQAVLAAMIDFSKAFNRQNHNILITILHDMGVPGFLSNRSMILRYNGASAKRRSLPGGGPQGTILGMFLFIILINKAGFPNVQRNLGIHQTQVKRKPVPITHQKYVDDLTLSQSLQLNQSLIFDPNIPKPAMSWW